MLNTQEFGDFLHNVGLKDFVGVPCSYLSPLINYAINEKRFIMSNNEGDAVAIASGISLGHSACGDFLGKEGHSALSDKSAILHSDFRLRTSSARPQSSLESPDFSSQILECQGESLPKESHSVSESSPKNSGGISESIFLDSHSLLESTTSDSKASPSCHSEPKSSESSLSDSNVNLKSTHATYGIVLMQNSGLSNALSPLTSLNHTFKIPILGFVSLRGERDAQGKNTDEPQHELLGIITDKLLETCQVPYAFLDSDMERAKHQVAEALAIMAKGESFFFIVREGTFSKVKLLDSAKHLDSRGNSSLGNQFAQSLHPASLRRMPNTPHSQGKAIAQSNTANTRIVNSQVRDFHTNSESPTDSSNTQNPLPTRLNALETIHALALKHQALLLATTGKCGRELYEIKDTPNQLYMVGSMGCVSALSLGLSLASPQKVIAIDGDSALLMRLGTLSTNAYYARGNFCHILLDNESHDSTGGQFNLSPFVSFPSIARACGYTHVCEARNIEGLGLALKEFLCDSNSSLGNQFAQSLYPASLRRMPNTPHSQGEAIAQSNTANTRIVGGEIPESHSISESSLKDSKKVSESTLSDSRPLSESKAPSYFIYLKIAKGSKDNLGRPKITPQEVAKRLSAYMQEWKQNHAHIESSQNLADTQNKTCANSTQDSQTPQNQQDLQASQNSGQALDNETNLANDLRHTTFTTPK